MGGYGLLAACRRAYGSSQLTWSKGRWPPFMTWTEWTLKWFCHHYKHCHWYYYHHYYYNCRFIHCHQMYAALFWL